MESLINYADRYIKKATWKDIALLKVCLCSAGVVIGTSVCDKTKKPIKQGAKVLFVATYIPLIIKAAAVLLENDTEKKGC